MGFTAERPLSGVIALATLAFALTACGGSGGDDQGSGLRALFIPAPPPAGSDVVFFRLRNSDGPLVVLDVVGREIGAPIDALHLVVGFDPVYVEAFGALNITFMGTCGRTRPDNTLLLCQDNISNGAANQTGVLLFSIVPQGTPVPETVTGEVVLATLSFRANAVGTSSIDFYVAGRQAPGGSYSQVVSSSDPPGAALVEFVPDAPGQAFIEVKRSP